jgi:hypothetical protein
VEAADRLGITPDDAMKKAIRAAVSAALTVAPVSTAGNDTAGSNAAGDTAVIGWQAAGRLEHAVFHLLGLGPARSTVPPVEKKVSVFTSDDRALAERLLRRGAAAAAAASESRLTLEDGAAGALLSAGSSGPIVSGGSGRMLCVDDTHRLLSQSLREAGWKVTPW